MFKYCNNGGKIENQRNSSFCSAYSTTSYLTAYYSKIYGEQIEFSPLFAMKNAKDHDRNSGSTGTYLKVLVEQTLKDGVCEEKLYPTSLDKDFLDNEFPTIPKKAIDNAKKYRPHDFNELSVSNIEVDTLKRLVVENAGCLLALNIFENYFDKYKDIFVRKPKKNDPHVVGRHAIYLCGFNDNIECSYDGEHYKGFFILMESYGEKGLSDGYIYLPYKFIEDKVTGLYTSDRFVDDVFYYEYSKDDIRYPNIHDTFEVYEPKRVIELTLNSDIAYVDGIMKKLSAPAILQDGRTLVPFRFLSEAFGCNVRFQSENKLITAYSKEPNYVVEMYADNPILTKRSGGKVVKIESDVPPSIINGNTMVPIRAISEILDCKVNYSGGKIKITGML